MAERAAATVDLGAIQHNCGRVRDVIGENTKLCAVVKANAYGHGAAACAKAARAGGADWLAVATAGEAAELERQGTRGPVLILGALTPEEARLAIGLCADVVVWEPEFALALAAVAEALNVTCRIHVKFDTGMGRLGARDPAQVMAVAEVVAAAKHLQLVGMMTHFATADDRDDDFFDHQLATFATFARGFREIYPDAIVHAANSAAAFRDRASHFDVVRCGVALYGLDPFQQDPDQCGLQQAITVRSYVAAVRPFQRGESVGYGRAWKAHQPTHVATLPIGYGDGWQRSFTDNVDLLIGGRRYPVVGRVSTDNMTVDLGPDTDIRPGATATLIGRDGEDRITVEELASRVGTINYDVTCGLTERVRRHWGAA